MTRKALLFHTCKQMTKGTNYRWSVKTVDGETFKAVAFTSESGKESFIGIDLLKMWA